MATLLWLDDMRNPAYNAPQFDGKIEWVKSYAEFQAFIYENGLPEKISFDYSLGDMSYDGISCVKCVLRYCEQNNLPFPRYAIHSEHPYVYKLREYIEYNIYFNELGEAVEEDRKPDTEDQKEVNKRREEEKLKPKGILEGLRYKAPTNVYIHKPVEKKPTIAQVIRSSPKVGRNEPCNCGSNKKYKHCHGK